MSFAQKRGSTATGKSVAATFAGARRPAGAGLHGGRPSSLAGGQTAPSLRLYTVFLSSISMGTVTCTVLRTHRLGERLAESDWAPPQPGTVHMHSTARPGSGHADVVLSMVELAKFGRAKPAPIPDLLEPELLMFDSQRGMMVCGYEDVDGGRFYQGWWIQWHPHGIELPCAVVRTHRLGQRLRESAWPTPIAGSVRTATVHYENLKRSITTMELTPSQPGRRRNASIPPLCQPTLQTFSSDRGMMLFGFEEIDCRKHFQAWWFQWHLGSKAAPSPMPAPALELAP